MFHAGDEFLHTQRGNNNPYNQDNETTWLDWSHAAQNEDFARFFKAIVAFRRTHPTLCRNRFWRKEVRWYGADGGPDFSLHSHSIAYLLKGKSFADLDLYVMINGWREPLKFAIQDGLPGAWKRVIDTGLASPDDIVERAAAPVVAELEYELAPRSIAVLMRG